MIRPLYERSGYDDQHEDHALKELRLRLRNAALAAEEVMDEFSYYMPRCPNVRLIGMCRAFFSMATTTEQQHIVSRAAATISVMRKLTEVYFRIQRSTVRGTLPPSLAHPRNNHLPFSGDQPYVGFHKEREELEEMLMEEDLRQVVAAVKGMGGLDKAMLVSKAYQQVRSRFECSAWIILSQSYINVEEIRLHILHQTKHGDDGDKDDLAPPLVDHLRSKKYLIVLDDVWDIKVWRALNAASPNNSRGSRIVVTTRSEKLVHYLGEFRRCLKLKPLNDEYAWELFCMVAFHGRHCLQDLEQSENEIVSRCSCLNCQPNGWL